MHKTPETIQIITNANIEFEATINSCTNSAVTSAICNQLFSKQFPQASEMLVNESKTRFSFYTTKVDDRNEIWVYQDGIYLPNGKSVIREYCRKVTGVLYNEYVTNMVISKIETDTFIDQEKFFNKNIKEEIAVRNGILNLKTKELTPFDSKKVFFSKINANYVPGVSCPKIDIFFKEVLPEESDVQSIYEMFGYSLYKDYFIERAFMLLGSGRNGKGKTLNILKHFLSEDNVVGIPLQKLESGEFKECGLLNKLANIAGDISGYPLKETNKFKSLTGRDIISASRKFKTDVSFVNYAKLIFSTNNLPKTYDLSVGFFDRWVFVVFPYTFKEQNEYSELMKTLSESEKVKYRVMDEHRIDGLLDDVEMSGLLNASLAGLDRLFVNKSFTSSKTGEATRKFWIRNSDSFLAFVNEFIEIDSDGSIDKEVLRKAYQKYCKVNKVLSEGDRHIKEVLVRQYTAGEEQQFTTMGEHRRNWVGVRFKQGVVNFLGGDVL
jgi:putative DNA primase/helicase